MADIEKRCGLILEDGKYIFGYADAENRIGPKRLEFSWKDGEVPFETTSQAFVETEAEAIEMAAEFAKVLSLLTRLTQNLMQEDVA